MIEIKNELILNWMRHWDLDESLLWKKDSICQACFVRDEICRRLLKIPCFVISTHVSKSCLLPVYYFRLNNCIEVICRNNFHGWVVSVKTPTPECDIHFPYDLIYGDGERRNGDIHPVYCEGFRDEWVYHYNDTHKTTFRVDDDFRLWALMRELNRENWGWDARFEEVFLNRDKETILQVLHDAKCANENLNNSDIFEQSYFYDTEKYYTGCMSLWEDDEQLAERILENDDLFNMFAREWETIKWGLNFGIKPMEE